MLFDDGARLRARRHIRCYALRALMLLMAAWHDVITIYAIDAMLSDASAAATPLRRLFYDTTLLLRCFAFFWRCYADA